MVTKQQHDSAAGEVKYFESLPILSDGQIEALRTAKKIVESYSLMLKRKANGSFKRRTKADSN